MSRILYFDCFSGASGDMVLGALVDAGLPLDELRRALGSLTIGGYAIEAAKVLRAGVAATKMRVTEHAHRHGAEHPHHDAHARHHGRAGAPREDGHADAGHDHAHRRLDDICRLIDGSALSAAGKTRACELFRRLADAEAAIHQTPIERVHLHEVGALDSIVDIVGAVFALEWIGADRIVASPLNVGSGTVTCAHGTFPVPAPATARLLAGVPIYSTGVAAELVTPTGALLVTGYAREYGPLPPMRVTAIGYGAGDRDPAGMPNVLRVFVGQAEDGIARERVAILECEIDDMNPQIFGVVMDQLYAAGALDVLYTPVQMKKNRPGTLVTVVAPPERRDPLSAVLFRETTTLGVRYQEVERECLDREVVEIATPIGPVRFKVARRRGAVVNAAPEFDDCARLAAERGLSVKEVQAIATKAYLDRPS